MARIFISHSSSDNEHAIALRDWLAANGWDDFFLDLDPQQGIVAGERWKEALKEAAHRCEAVLALVSPDWLKRDWCRAELASAALLGKKIFVLLIGSNDADLASSLKDAQYVDLLNDPDAYIRLKEGLNRAGLDPTSFPFAEGRRPYPGFAPLEEEDAAIFFGRDAQIVRGLDKLRGLVRGGVERVFFILGASGSGKSSFLRAGLLPRLRRDDAAWLPLPPIRPERAVLTGKFGMVEALYDVVNQARFSGKFDSDVPSNRAALEELITTRDDGLATILEALRQAGRGFRTPGKETSPTIVIPIDQGEELFNEEGRDEDTRFIEILAKTLEVDRRVLVVLTMRTDSFPQVQNHPVLSTLPQDTYTLPRMPEGSYRTVVEGPAALAKPPLEVDPELTEALLQDAAGQDALALLAFTLRQLYDRYLTDCALTLESYDKLGRLKGIIEATVKGALADGAAAGELPNDEETQRALIRKTFIPHLARVNAAGQFVRRVATRAEIPGVAHPLIDRFAETRLLIKDRRKTDGRDESSEQETSGDDIEVIEVAHEALLREWGDLNEALDAEKDFLKEKAQLERDLAEWQVTPEVRKKGALLSGNKLNHARDWLLQRPQDLTADETRFIQASADAETARRRWMRSAAAAAFIVIAAAGALAAWQWRNALEALAVAVEQERIAERERNRAEGAAEEARSALRTAERNAAGGLAALSTIAKDGGDPVNSAKLALAAWPRTESSEGVQLKEVIANLSEAAPQLFERQWLRDRRGDVRRATFSVDGKRFAIYGSGTGADGVILRDATTGRVLGTHQVYPHGANFAFSPDGKLFAASSNSDDAAMLWDLPTATEPIRLAVGSGPVPAVAFSPDGAILAVGSYEGDISVWAPQDLSHPTNTIKIGAGGGPEVELWHLAISPDGRHLVTGSRDSAISLWDIETGLHARTLAEAGGDLTALGYSPDGAILYTVGSGWPLRLWDTVSHRERLPQAKFELGGPGAFAFSPDGSELAVGGPDGSIRLHRLQTDLQTTERILEGHAGGTTSVTFSKDGTRLLSGGNDGTARLWSLAEQNEIARFGRATARVAAVAFQRGGKHISVGYADGTARAYDVIADPTVSWQRIGDEAIGTAILSPNGTQAAVRTGESEVKIYKMGSWIEIASISVPENTMGPFAVSSDAIVLKADDTFKIRKLQNNTGSVEIPSFNNVKFIEFSRDGTRLAVGGGYRYEGLAKVVDTATGESLLDVAEQGSGAVESITFSSDGSRALLRFRVGAAPSSEARWYDIPHVGDDPQGSASPTDKTFSPKADLTLVGLGSVQNLVLSPEGSRAVGTDGATVRVWDMTTGAQIAHFSGHEERVRQVVFGSTVGELYSISENGTVGLWNLSALPLGNVFDVVCQLLPDHNLESALRNYPILVNEPICVDGNDPPLPRWMNVNGDRSADRGDP